MTPHGPEARPIYVGYLPVPDRHRRLLRALVPLLALAAIAIALAIAALQRDPGPARWGDETVTIRGTLALTPYPVVVSPEGPVLLVAQGKFGAAGLEDLRGATVEARGTLLERNDARMLELVADNPVSSAQADRATLTPDSLAPGPGTPVTMRGEIVDSKCCLGAMKPGEGKTHRACATLCIRGGIPPILVSAGAAGEPVYTLLTDEAGGAANALVLPLIAEPVEITGTLSEHAGLRILAIETVRPAPR